MIIRESVSLSAHTTFRIGGRARYFVVIESLDLAEFLSLVDFADNKKLPLFVVGAGSNLLVTDDDIEAVVVHIASHNDIQYTERPNDVLCVAAAGELWDDVVAHVVARGYGGIENLSLIPGTVGAAPVQNIGAYGTELVDVLEWVEVFDPVEKNIRRFTAAQCQLEYRSSFFKTPAGKHLIVLRVALRLQKNAAPNISYKDLARHFESTGNTSPTLAQVRDAVVSIRRTKLPDPARVPNAGSFFKNPVIEKRTADELAVRFPGLPLFPLPIRRRS